MSPPGLTATAPIKKIGPGEPKADQQFSQLPRHNNHRRFYRAMQPVSPAIVRAAVGRSIEWPNLLATQPC